MLLFPACRAVDPVLHNCNQNFERSMHLMIRPQSCRHVLRAYTRAPTSATLHRRMPVVPRTKGLPS